MTRPSVHSLEVVDSSAVDSELGSELAHPTAPEQMVVLPGAPLLSSLLLRQRNGKFYGLQPL